MKIAFDLDGILVNSTEYIKKYLMGEKKDWNAYLAHTLEFPRIEIMTRFFFDIEDGDNNEIYFVTGRPESNRELTKVWIGRKLYFDVGTTRLLMRPNGNKQDGADLKLDMFKVINPDIVFEDDPVACEKMSKAGYMVLQVHGYRCNESKTDRIPE